MSLLTDNCLWWQNTSLIETAPISKDEVADVAIIGAGFTGLWTAYFIRQLRPNWRISIFEQHHVGYGASGRNGGWLIGGISNQEMWLQSLPLPQQTETRQLLYGIVESVKTISEKENIQCGLQHAGVVYSAARYSEQLSMAKQWYKSFKAAGHDESDFRWLNASDAETYVTLPKQQGAIFSPHCATLNPAQLVIGLAQVLITQGVKIFQNARVNRLNPRVIEVNDHFQVKAETIVIATEAFRNPHKALNKKRLPVFSAAIATSTLSEAEWQSSIKTPGLAFGDVSRSVTYGQRTSNNELVFGARGGYLFGGRSQFELTPTSPIFNAPKTYFKRLLPNLNLEDVHYHWAGSLAMSRRFSPYVGIDAATGFATAGGYGGEGVGASHLFGHTLAELICGVESPRTSQPWVDQSVVANQSNWEPEPIPWLAYQLINKTFSIEDYLCHENKWPWLRKPSIHLADWLEDLMH